MSHFKEGAEYPGIDRLPTTAAEIVGNLVSYENFIPLDWRIKALIGGGALWAVSSYKGYALRTWAADYFITVLANKARQSEQKQNKGSPLSIAWSCTLIACVIIRKYNRSPDFPALSYLCYQIPSYLVGAKVTPLIFEGAREYFKIDRYTYNEKYLYLITWCISLLASSYLFAQISARVGAPLPLKGWKWTGYSQMGTAGAAMLFHYLNSSKSK